MDVLKSEDDVADYMHQFPENCVFLHTASCMLFCYQCDMEIYDCTSETIEKRSSEDLTVDKETIYGGLGNTYLDLRKLFVKRETKKPKKGKNIDLQGCPSASALLPLNSLNNTLVVLYSIDYIRKTLKKKYVCNNYSQQHYGVNLFPNFLTELSATVFQMNKGEDSSQQFEKFYQLLARYDPAISSYRYNNFYVS